MGTEVPTTAGEGAEASSEKARDAAAAATTKRLYDLLKGAYAAQDLYVGLLMAIGLQPPTSVSKEVRDTLAECALKGRLGKDEAQSLVRAYAALTLGRIGGKEEVGVLKNILSSRKNMDDGIQRSAAIGLGVLGRQLPAEERLDVAKVILQAMDKTKDDSVKNFGLISLAYLLIADVKEGRTDLLTGKGADEMLLETATDGRFYQRPFGALALALVVSHISEKYENDAWQEFKSKSLELLRAGIDDQKMDKQGRAGFCAALGIAGDNTKRARLVQIVADRKEDKEFRGYAALALGLINEPVAEVTKAIAEALKERSSEELRRQTATALGLLGNPKIGGTGQDAIQVLLDELKVANSQAHKGEVVVALARIGDDKAVDPLVTMLKDKGEQDLSRALACAGLGLIGDLEWLPSLSRVSKDINYRSSTDLINEVLSIL
jgi:HEAT repeat protein